MEIFNVFHLESARRLPGLPDSHPCSHVHGHSFRVTVHVEGEIDPATGWVIDFAEIEAAFEPIRAQLDHRYLNDVPGLQNPSTEMLAQWIWARLAPAMPLLSKIVIHETERSGCVYRGPASS